MGCRINLRAKRESADQVRRRYWSAKDTQKRKILDEYIAVTGYHPKAAVELELPRFGGQFIVLVS
jgi:hypothetical protein